MGGGALLVGAHPDDIEIAAGGLLARLVLAGVSVLTVVASDETDRDVARTRRDEAVVGLGALGVVPECIEFLALDDRAVDAAEGAVRLREVLALRGFVPDLVITHSVNDRHADHRAVAAMVAHALGPSTPVLGMAVVNSVTTSFCPHVLVDTSVAAPAKWRALRSHRSQVERGRIRYAEIRLRESAQGRAMGCRRAEGFEFVTVWDPERASPLELVQPWFIESPDRRRS